jgi:hypothetical protein
MTAGLFPLFRALRTAGQPRFQPRKGSQPPGRRLQELFEHPFLIREFALCNFQLFSQGADKLTLFIQRRTALGQFGSSSKQ